MRLVIYTAIFGNYDVLTPPKIIDHNVRYVCFSDKKIECPPWEIRIVKSEYRDLMRENRKYKILSHKYFEEYEYCIYLDGRITIMCDLSKYVKKWLGENDIAVLKHLFSNCLYKEAKACIKSKKDDIELIIINRYEIIKEEKLISNL